MNVIENYKNSNDMDDMNYNKYIVFISDHHPHILNETKVKESPFHLAG